MEVPEGMGIHGEGLSDDKCEDFQVLNDNHDILGVYKILNIFEIIVIVLVIYNDDYKIYIWNITTIGTTSAIKVQPLQ